MEEKAIAKASGCPRCSGEMEIGFLLDRGHTKWLPASWVAGAPEIEKWSGSVKVREGKLYRVETWRCKDCGYLESYGKTQVVT